ncbi:unnamed protein product, partial [Rotaria sp. Silwood2]
DSMNKSIDYRVNRYFLPKTKTLIINHIKSFYDPIKISLLSHIRCLILCQPTREQWNSIQPLYFPYLERNNQEKIQILNSNKNHSTLRRLALHLSGPITRDFIDSILSFVSNLENFVLDIKYQRPSYISLNTLASIFEYRTPRLNRVNINMTLPESLCCKEQMDTKYSLFTACKIQPELNQLTRLIVVGSLRR